MVFTTSVIYIWIANKQSNTGW